MRHSRKVYRVTLGMIDDAGTEFTNWDSKNVIAGEVEEAIKKSKSRRKGIFISGVELLHEIDKL